MQNQKSKFKLEPKHLFVLLGTAIIAEEAQEDAYRTSAMCAVTVPEVTNQLLEEGYIAFTEDNLIPVLTRKGFMAVQKMLEVPTVKMVTPHKPPHFDEISDSHLLELPSNSLKAIKQRARRSSVFAEKMLDSSKLKEAAANLEFLIMTV